MEAHFAFEFEFAFELRLRTHGSRPLEVLHRFPRVYIPIIRYNKLILLKTIFCAHTKHLLTLHYIARLKSVSGVTINLKFSLDPQF